jgi:hypothetical protein
LAFDFDMKRVLLFTFLFCFNANLFAQTYQRILGNSNEFYLLYCSLGGCFTDYYATDGDTLIGNETYIILDYFHFNRGMFIREDTITGKVYIMPGFGYKAWEDILAYDFSLQVGDTFNIYNPNTPLPNDAGLFVVDSVYFESIQGVSSKHIQLISLDTLQAKVKKTLWVEGIGSLFMITTPGAPANIATYGELSCFFRNNEYRYQSQKVIEKGTCEIYEAGIENNNYKDNLIVYPNPFTNTISFQYEESISNIKLYTMHGQKVDATITQTATNFYIIETSELIKGVYFLHFDTPNKREIYLMIKQ